MATRTSRSPRSVPVNGPASTWLSVWRNQLRISALVGRAPFPYRRPTTPDGVEPLRPKARLGADYDTAWARAYPARLARVLLVEGVVRPTMTALATPSVHGLDRLVDLEGPAVFAANHHSHVDTPLLLSTIPEPWRHQMVIGAAADYFFGNRLTAPLSALVIGAIPIERTKISRQSADDAATLISDGWSFLIFPEGGRSPDGWGQPFRGGAAYLARRCQVPVVPVHVEGTGQILPKGQNRPRPGRTSITFGRPLWAQDGEDSRALGARIHAAVEQLADESTTDWWSARRRAHQGTTPSLMAPGAAGAWRRRWALGDRSPQPRRARRSWPPLS